MKNKEKVLIVGAEWSGRTIASAITHEKKFSIVGFLDDKHPKDNCIPVQNGKGMVDIPLIGKSNQLYEKMSKEGANSVVLAMNESMNGRLLEQIVKCHEKGIRVYQMPDLYSKLTRKIPVKHVDQKWVVPRLKAPTWNFQTILCYALDFVISLMLTLFVFLPLFPLVALAIKLDSRGPIFFTQKRVGLNGRHFTLLKFRSMVDRAHEKGDSWTTEGDARITRVGQLLRKFRIDELPQLINILKGQMSLIGPRPEAVDLVEQFKNEIPFYEYRYLVKPGITGWAQVNYSNTCSVEGALEKLQYDLFWIKNRSIWLNLQIIFKSIKVVFTGYGAV